MRQPVRSRRQFNWPGLPAVVLVGADVFAGAARLTVLPHLSPAVLAVLLLCSAAMMIVLPLLLPGRRR